MTNLTQAEIWDDSTLVDSWNEALHEYDRYHSMHARGEKVEDVLKTQESEKENPSAAALIDEQSEVNDQVLEDNEFNMEQPIEEKAPTQSVTSKTAAQASASSPSGQHAPALPQHLIGQVHDEGLKNLLMSWYYAGYYTGLYEGQRMAKKD